MTQTEAEAFINMWEAMCEVVLGILVIRFAYYVTAVDIHLYSKLLMYISLFPNSVISELRHMYLFCARFFLLYSVQLLNLHQGLALVLASVFGGILFSLSISFIRRLLRHHVQIEIQRFDNNVIMSI